VSRFRRRRPESDRHSWLTIDDRQGAPRTNGFVERMNRALLDECFRVAGRTTWYLEPAEIQRDLDAFLDTISAVAIRLSSRRPRARAGAARGAGQRWRAALALGWLHRGGGRGGGGDGRSVGESEGRVSGNYRLSTPSAASRVLSEQATNQCG